MDQTINIPFSIRLEAGDTTFRIDVDKKFTNDANRLFGFSSVTLTPDYYSRQAFKLDLDSVEELKAEICHDYYMEVEYDNNVFDSSPYTASGIPIAFHDILRTINAHWENHMVYDLMTPFVVFDWVHIRALAKGTDKETFYKDNFVELYGVEYDASNPPASVLPSAFQNLDLDLNPLPFPTKKEVLSDIRIRMTLAPNMTVAFSNTILPKAMGFADTQYTQIAKQQYKIQNTNKANFKSVMCFAEPTFDDVAYATKIHIYPTTKIIVSERGTFKTTKERERKPALLVKDYNDSLSALAKTMNLTMSIEHQITEKKFKIIFPTSEQIRVVLKVPPYIGHRLGYGHINLITNKLTNVSYPDDGIEINNVEAISRVLVYDTGMVVVSLDQQASQQTHQFTSTVMAILESDDAGVMTTKPGMDFLHVPVSNFNPNLDFVLSRFSESNEPIPLGWKVGAYIRGVLVGKV